jgi:hypothetical protein
MKVRGAKSHSPMLRAFVVATGLACLSVLTLIPGQAKAEPRPVSTVSPNSSVEPVMYGRRYRRYGYRAPYVAGGPPTNGIIYRHKGYYWFPRVPGYPYYAPYSWPHFPPY